MRLSEHDREMVAEVAAFCSTDPHREPLGYVWFSGGWVAGTDSYRIDAREVDEQDYLAVNPVTLREWDRRYANWRGDPYWLPVEKYWRRFSRKPLAVLPPMGEADLPKGPGRVQVCLGCLVTSPEASRPACRCTEPVVMLRFLREAIAAADFPKVRWIWTGVTEPIVYVEDGHRHVLMPIRVLGR